MNLHQWLDRLHYELQKRGLPSGYSARLMEELTEHFADIQMENQSIDAEQDLESRLGTPEQLALIAKTEFRRRTFAIRHPVLTFLAGPIAVAIGAMMTTYLAILLVTCLCVLVDPKTETTNPISSDENAVIAYRVCQSFSLFINFVPFVLSACLFVALGRRTGLHPWSLVACNVVAFISLIFKSYATLQLVPDRRVYVEIDFPSELNLSQLIQAAVPLAFGLCLYWYLQRNASKHFPSSPDKPFLTASV